MGLLQQAPALAEQMGNLREAAMEVGFDVNGTSTIQEVADSLDLDNLANSTSTKSLVVHAASNDGNTGTEGRYTPSALNSTGCQGVCIDEAGERLFYSGRSIHCVTKELVDGSIFTTESSSSNNSRGEVVTKLGDGWIVASKWASGAYYITSNLAVTEIDITGPRDPSVNSTNYGIKSQCFKRDDGAIVAVCHASGSGDMRYLFSISENLAYYMGAERLSDGSSNCWITEKQGTCMAVLLRMSTSHTGSLQFVKFSPYDLSIESKSDGRYSWGTTPFERSCGFVPLDDGSGRWASLPRVPLVYEKYLMYSFDPLDPSQYTSATGTVEMPDDGAKNIIWDVRRMTATVNGSSANRFFEKNAAGASETPIACNVYSEFDDGGVRFDFCGKHIVMGKGGDICKIVRTIKTDFVK